MIWEIRSSATAGNVNSGGFNPAGGGTDYTLQDAAQFIGTDLASSNGTNATPTVTSASHSFVAADVGNTIRISAGTNWTTGVYEITSVSGGGAILDRACGSAASLSSGTWNEGGAFSLQSAAGIIDDAVFELGVAGNKFYIKSGSYTLGGTVSISVTGGTQSPITIEGYNTTRGDSPKSTDRPTIDCGATIFACNTNWDVKNVIFTGTGTNVLSPGASGRIRYVKCTNTSGTAGRSAITGTLNSFLFGVEASSTNGQAITSSTTFMAVYCYFHSSDIGINSTITTTGQTYIECISKGNTTAAFKTTGAATGPIVLESCTFYGAETPAGTGLSLATGTTNIRLLNSIVYGFVTGVSHADAQTVGYENFCCFYNNTTDRTNWEVGMSSIALNPNFTNAASGDFSVGVNMRAAGYPGLFPGGLTTGYKDIGAVQRKEVKTIGFSTVT